MPEPRQSQEYKLDLSPAAARDLRHLAKRVGAEQLKSIDEKIRSLALVPRPDGCEKLSGTGDVYRIRDGDYRILYAVLDDSRRVEIARVGNRKDIYRR